MRSDRPEPGPPFGRLRMQYDASNHPLTIVNFVIVIRPTTAASVFVGAADGDGVAHATTILEYNRHVRFRSKADMCSAQADVR